MKFCAPQGVFDFVDVLLFIFRDFALFVVVAGTPQLATVLPLLTGRAGRRF
jgi:hypothetical protein